MSAIKIGDRITFRAATRWASGKATRKATRKVNGFDSAGRPTVRYGGWKDFSVRLSEIEEFIPS